MNGKLALETTKKLLLNNVLLVLVYLVFQTVTNFAGNEYIKVSTYALAALHLISIVLYALCIATIVISLYKTFVVDLLSGESYKYFSLPYKKSEIIFSKAVPAIIIESLMVVILLDLADIYILIALSLDKIQYEGNTRAEMLNECLSHLINLYVPGLMIAVTIGFQILLAFVISRSFDPSKTVRNLLIAIVIEALANSALYIVFENISSAYSIKFSNAVEAFHPLSSKELYSAVGSLAYYEEILSAVIVLILTVEIICSIIASKKLADKRFNVL